MLLKIMIMQKLKGAKTVLEHPIFSVLLQAYQSTLLTVVLAVRESGVDTKRNHSSVKR